MVRIFKNSIYKTGWSVQARVQIKMHERDKVSIQSIQEFFGNKGYVSKVNNSLTVEFRISTLKSLIYVVLPYYDKYPLLIKKTFKFFIF